MPKIKTILLTNEQRAALVQGADYGAPPSFRLRCRAVLLKSEERTSLSVAKELGCCLITRAGAGKQEIQNWVTLLVWETGRYRRLGGSLRASGRSWH